jgi:hypothetical protein
MWKANGKTTTLLFFLESLFPKTEKNEKKEREKGREDEEEDIISYWVALRKG